MLLRYRRLILIDLAALFFLSFVMVNTSSAQGEPASIVFDSVQVFSCQDDILQGYLAMSVLDASGQIIDPSNISDLIITFDTGLMSLFTFLPAKFINGASFAIEIPDVGDKIVDIRVSLSADQSVQSPLLRINCAALTYEIFGDSGQGGDGRLNPNAGDLLNVLYIGTDDTGSPSIDVYQVDGDIGLYIGEFEYALFEPYLDTPPSANTALGTVDKTVLYALTSGEFQINIGPDAEGKYGIVIFSGLPPASTRRSILELR